MQTEKFTLFDFNKLQDPTKQEQYQKIIETAHSIKRQISERQIHNYNRPIHYVQPDLSISYQMQRATELIQSINGNGSDLSLKTANEKLLFITAFVFHDNQKFINTLNFYGIDKESCVDFSEEVKNLSFYDSATTTDRLTLLIAEYFEELPLIKKHYQTNNTGLLINKILEIAYLHPTLLNKKEKS